MKRYIVIIMAFAMALPVFAQKADRSKAPQPGEIRSLQLPEIQEFKLNNGLPVYLVEKNDVPIVQINLYFNAGSIFDPNDKLGLARLTADMMDEGAGDRDALALSEEIEYLGISLSTYANNEQLGVNLFSPTSKLNEALGLMSDVVLRPRFAEKELDRKRTEYIVRLAQAHDQSGFVATTAFQQMVFGKDHLYARPSGGTETTLKNMQVADLKKFHQEFITPANAYLVVVGDIDQSEAKMMLEKAFKGWSGGKLQTKNVPEPAKTKGMQVFVVDDPSAAQTQLRFGGLGVSRNTPDYYPITIMNTILGGSFTSRLNQNIREEHGYAYGAGSGFYQPKGKGYFVAQSAVQTDVTDKAIQEFMKELNAINEVSPEEVAKARNYEALGYPGEFQRIEQIAGNISEIVYHNLPKDYLNKHMDKLLKVTEADVERMAKTYVDTKNMVVMIVGDKSKIEEGLKGLKLGKITYLSKTDILGPVPKKDVKP